MNSITKIGQAALLKLLRPRTTRGNGSSVFHRVITFPKDYFSLEGPLFVEPSRNPRDRGGEPTYHTWRKFAVWGIALGYVEVPFENGESLIEAIDRTPDIQKRQAIPSHVLVIYHENTNGDITEKIFVHRLDSAQEYWIQVGAGLKSIA